MRDMNIEQERKLKLASEIDYARLAAYIDGEGCISLHAGKSSRTYRPGISIAQRDHRLMDWLEKVFGGAVYRSCRLMYHWVIGPESSLYILSHCMPYLVVKADQAQIVLDYQYATSEPKRRRLRLQLNQLKHGHKFVLARCICGDAEDQRILGGPSPSCPIHGVLHQAMEEMV